MSVVPNPPKGQPIAQSQSSSDTVLVTGGSGFLASWCIVELLRGGYDVRTTVRNPDREPEVREAVAREIDPAGRLSFFKADLLADDGWHEAVTGCRYVLHVASPFPPIQPANADELIVPAREGTLRVLKASLDAGVERIVVTSSVAAVERAAGEPPDKVLDENDWTDPASPKVSPYAKSKTIAEQSAWEFVERSDVRDRLVTVNPGAIVGPVLNADRSFSIQLVERMLRGEPAVPKLGYSIVDVRDIAALEVAAMTSPEAGGKRFIGVAEFTWMSQISETLRAKLGDDARKVPRFVAPNLLVKALGLFDGSVRSVTGQLGVKTEYSADRAKSMLGWRPRPVEESIVDCARSLIELGVVASAGAPA